MSTRPTPGEVVLEGATNVPTEFIPSSGTMMPPFQTMSPFATGPMNPAMQTRPLGYSPPGSFVGAPPPSMPYSMDNMSTMRPGSGPPYRPNVFNSMNGPPGSFSTMPPGSFNNGPPGSFFEKGKGKGWGKGKGKGGGSFWDDLFGSSNQSFRDGPPGPPGSFYGGPPPGSGFPPAMNLQDMPGNMAHNMSWAPQKAGPPQTSTSFMPMFGGVQQEKASFGGSRFQKAERTNRKLEDNLNEITCNAWKDYCAINFSALEKAGLGDVDWRVPRVNYCKEPKYNNDLPANVRKTVNQAKTRDGDMLEQVLGEEAIRTWAEEHPKSTIPPEEIVIKPGVPFIGVHPGYRRWDDMWEREMTLRNLGEAMRGDLNTSMPKPVLFGEDYQNFHQGKYLKDECPIA